MKTLFIIVLALICSAFFLFTNKPNHNAFANYMQKYNKAYETKEIQEYRMSIYYENLAKIEAHNATPGITYWMGINQFTDITEEEFVNTYLGALELLDFQNIPPMEFENDSSNGDIDWGTKGGVSPVKNQGRCGSCWAFSAVGTLESWNLIYGSKQLTQYSEQQLVDCSKSYGNQGCRGGWPSNALKYVKDKGITTSGDYPYVGVDQQCKKDGGAFKISGINSANSCSGLENGLQKQPISVAVDASKWSSYSGGIFNNCGTQLNHAVLLTAKSSTYWKIKNSWGGWGEQGYIRLAPGNTCGVCNVCVWPTK